VWVAPGANLYLIVVRYWISRSANLAETWTQLADPSSGSSLGGPHLWENLRENIWATLGGTNLGKPPGGNQLGVPHVGPICDKHWGTHRGENLLRCQALRKVLGESPWKTTPGGPTGARPLGTPLEGPLWGPHMLDLPW
jgi:hypothetical protein